VASGKRVWQGKGFKVFLSHKSSVKLRTGTLKDNLHVYGFDAFVAHADIKPTAAWQDVIEQALATMDGFVALMTPNFHDSEWTDQEIGYAIARDVPIIAVNLGTAPYGFIGKFQALSATWSEAPLEIVKALVQRETGLAAYIEAVKGCSSWAAANTLADVLPSIASLTERQVDQLVEAYNENGELRGGFGFNGSHPDLYGPGLAHHLNRLGRRVFEGGIGGIKERKRPKKK
jgi:hypothetical protein